MEGEYRNQAAMREDMDGSLGEDGPVGGAGVADRGLFGRRHGSDGEYASQAGGQGYGGRPPMPYDGGYGDSYGYEQRRPPAEVGYEGGYGGGAPPVYEEAAAASGLGYGEAGVPGGYGDRGHHGHSKKVGVLCHGYSNSWLLEDFFFVSKCLCIWFLDFVVYGD